MACTNCRFDFRPSFETRISKTRKNEFVMRYASVVLVVSAAALAACSSNESPPQSPLKDSGAPDAGSNSTGDAGEPAVADASGEDPGDAPTDGQASNQVEADGGTDSTTNDDG
jgi:hypothetical protein